MCDLSSKLKNQDTGNIIADLILGIWVTEIWGTAITRFNGLFHLAFVLIKFHIVKYKNILVYFIFKSMFIKIQPNSS